MKARSKREASQAVSIIPLLLLYCSSIVPLVLALFSAPYTGTPAQCEPLCYRGSVFLSRSRDGNDTPELDASGGVQVTRSAEHDALGEGEFL